VMDARIERLEGTETPVDVKVAGAHVPNVFVGVTALPVGLGEASPASGIPMRAGYAELPVSPDERRLKVQIEPSEDGYEPGDRAAVNVKVTDHRGRPARAEVTLWAADEGVLQLTGYKTPDPFAPVYEDHVHAVGTSTTLARWAQFDPGTWHEGGGDGAPGGEKSAMRSRFLSTAFFSKGVVTNPRGRARVKVKVPDNLTRWRVMAAVAGRGERFGKGESSFTVSKPLQVMPSLPRFMTQGDLVDAGLVVHNDTGRAGTAEVRLDVEGAELVGEAVKTVKLDDGGQQAVRFPLMARETGEVTLQARVRMNVERAAGGAATDYVAADAFERSLPVHSATAWNAEQLFDGRIGQEQRVRVPVPSHVEDGLAELVVTVSPSVFASMEGGLDALIRYPHGCVEQTTSQLIPMVLLEDLMKDLGRDRLAGESHRNKMNEAIAHVLKHQNHDGGFGLWPRSDSEGFLTAYALWGLLTAQKHGYEVPGGALDRGKRYLRDNARRGGDMHGQFGDEETAPFAAYVLAHAKQQDDGLGQTLAGQHAELSRFSVGLLANAMTRRRQRDATDPLFDAIERARRNARSGALVREKGGDGGVLHHGRDLRATSSAVQALVEAGRLDEAERLVAGIIAQRDDDGTWGHTYNNLWALYALSTYADAVDRGRATVPVEVSIGDWKRTVRITPSAKARQIAVPASALPEAGRSEVLKVRGGREDDDVRASVRLRYALDAAHQRPEDHGFRVERELFDAETGEVVESPQVGQLLRVRLTVHADGSQRQVAVVDRLPAGFEPIDTRLETATRRAQAGGSDYRWSWREIHDERVSFFADHLPAGESTAEYLARASRSGELVRPAPTAEAMYDPARWGRGEVSHLVIR
ncbi:MAG: alpha-2-macroglobulin family protein, partial [Polyangiales bacterium]